MVCRKSQLRSILLNFWDYLMKSKANTLVLSLSVVIATTLSRIWNSVIVSFIRLAIFSAVFGGGARTKFRITDLRPDLCTWWAVMTRKAVKDRSARLCLTSGTHPYSCLMSKHRQSGWLYLVSKPSSQSPFPSSLWTPPLLSLVQFSFLEFRHLFWQLSASCESNVTARCCLTSGIFTWWKTALRRL